MIDQDNDPDFLRYYAKVMLREAKARRGSSGNEWMVAGAIRAWRQASALLRPVQGSLF